MLNQTTHEQTLVISLHSFDFNSDLLKAPKTLQDLVYQFQHKKEHVSIMHDIECTCKIQWYTIFMLSLSILGLIAFIILNARKLKLFRGHLFSNAVKIMLFISDALYYVLVKLCKTTGSIHLFKITGKLTPEHIKSKRKIL